MRKICRASQSGKSIHYGSILFPKNLTLGLKTAYKLTTIGLLLVSAGISGCNSSSNQVIKAQESEGKTYVGSMNRAQQVNLLDKNKFATNLNELKLGIKPETDSYIFKVVPQSSQNKSVMNIAQAKREGLKSFVGLVYFTKVNDEEKLIAQLCETSQALSVPPQMPSLTENASESEDIECPSGFTALN